MKAANKQRRVIDWRRVWRLFDEWFDNYPYLDPAWNKQKRKIRELIDKELRVKT